MPTSNFFQGLTLSRAKASLLLGTAFALAGLAFFASQLWADPKPADLSESPFALTTNMLAEWQDGDVIVFVRHLERCSRVDAACLDGPTGITQRATATGLAMREQFAELGLAASDIYSSPLTRTSQTSALLFAQPTANEDFLYQCKDDFVKEALASAHPETLNPLFYN